MKKMKIFISALILGIFLCTVNVWAEAMDYIILDHVAYSLNLDGESFAAWTGLKEGEWTERLVVRNEINGLPVTYLPSTAFYGTNVYEVVLPNMLTLIQDSVFQNSDIKKLTIPASVDRVGQWLATGCKNLETVMWNTTIDIPDFSFSDDIKLQQVKLAEGLERIGYGTFSNCVSLNDIELPGTLTSIEDQAFYGCKSLKKLYIPTSVKYIGASAFGKIPGLVLQGARNSYASYYAKAQGIPFQCVGAAEKPITDQPIIRNVKINGNTITCSLIRDVPGSAGYTFFVLDEYTFQSDQTHDYSDDYLRKIYTDTPYVTIYNLPKGKWKIVCKATVAGQNGKWSNEVPIYLAQPPVEKPSVVKTVVKGGNVTVTVKTKHPQKSKGYDCVLAKDWKFYGPEHKAYTIKNKKTSTITFQNVKPGTYYVGAHSFVRENVTSGLKVFGEWSEPKKIVVK